MKDAILFRSSLCRPGRTFPNYIPHVATAAILLRQPTDRLTPDVRSVARGLRGARDLSSGFPNYLMADDFPILVQVSNLSAEFGQSAFFPFLSLLRAHSETLWMRRADYSDRLTEFSPHGHNVLVGVRAVGEGDFLLAKFARRGEFETRMHSTASVFSP